MEVSASTVKELREKTGAGMMDCKKALAESGGDLQRAVDYLRQKGLAAAAKKAERSATDGAVGAYVHPGGKIGVLIEINCETDFVARTPEFQALLKDIAMQVAAANPRVVRREEVSSEELEKEKSIYRQQALETGKPEKVIEKIIEGKIERFYSEICLMEQAFIKDPTNEIIGNFLHSILPVFRIVGIYFLLLFGIFEMLNRDAPVIAHRHPVLLCDLLHMSDDLLAAFFRQLGDGNADHLAVITRRETEVGFENRFFDLGHGIAIKRLDDQQPGLRSAQRGKLVQRGCRAIIIDNYMLQKRCGCPAGSEFREFLS